MLSNLGNSRSVLPQIFSSLCCALVFKEEEEKYTKKIQPLKFIASDFFAIKIYRKTKNTLELNLVFLSLLSAMRRKINKILILKSLFRLDIALNR